MSSTTYTRSQTGEKWEVWILISMRYLVFMICAALVLTPVGLRLCQGKDEARVGWCLRASLSKVVFLSIWYLTGAATLAPVLAPTPAPTMEAEAPASTTPAPDSGSTGERPDSVPILLLVWQHAIKIYTHHIRSPTGGECGGVLIPVSNPSSTRVDTFMVLNALGLNPIGLRLGRGKDEARVVW